VRLSGTYFRKRILDANNNISPLGRARRDKQRCRNYTVKNPDKNLDRFSQTCLCLAYQKNVASVRRRSTTDGKRVRKRMYGRTNGRFKERPRSSSLFAKIALSAGKILLSQRTTVNHRCESTKARLAVERKEGPITIDRPAKRIEALTRQEE